MFRPIYMAIIRVVAQSTKIDRNMFFLFVSPNGIPRGIYSIWTVLSSLCCLWLLYW